MKPESQRIAIGEACGITVKEYTRNDHRKCFCVQDRNGICIGDFGAPLNATVTLADAVHYLPNYLNSLDVMHEAEKVLTDEQGSMYRHILSMNSDGPLAKYLTVERAMCHATAAERAEAFLKATSKWEKS